MTAVQLVVKVCRSCGEEKPGGEFPRNRANKDGLHSYCKPCNVAQVKRRQAEQRQEMGEEAYLRHKRRIVDRSRRKPEVLERTRLGNRVKTEATRRLREHHRDEYEHLLAVVWSEAERGEFS